MNDTLPLLTSSDHNLREFQRNFRDEQLDDELDNLLLSLDQEDSTNDHDSETSKKSAELAQKIVSEIGKAKEVRNTPTRFPVTHASAVTCIDDPLWRLDVLMTELLQNGDYYAVRDEYCQLAILLNLQKRLAPAYRPKLNTGKKWGDPVFIAIHRDQIVIDCHWLHATKQPPKLSERNSELKPMFHVSRPFPFDLAWEFAIQKWKLLHRTVETLRLTPFQQCQLAALRSPELKQLIESIERGNRKGGVFFPAPLSVFEQSLSAWCERDKRIHRYRDGYKAVWMARSLLGAAAPVRQVGELVALMTGENAKDDKTIRSREKNINRHILGI